MERFQNTCGPTAPSSARRSHGPPSPVAWFSKSGEEVPGGPWCQGPCWFLRFFRDAITKMKDVYLRNPQMGDPASLDHKLAEVSQNIEKLRLEAQKFEVRRSRCWGRHGEWPCHSCVPGGIQGPFVRLLQERDERKRTCPGAAEAGMLGIRSHSLKATQLLRAQE